MKVKITAQTKNEILDFLKHVGLEYDYNSTSRFIEDQETKNVIFFVELHEKWRDPLF